jgi:hypothetical protein
MPDTVFHTPGAFGNYLAHLLDCHRQGTMLDDPFTGSGSSHNRNGSTRSMDIVLDQNWHAFNESRPGDLGVWWPEEHFDLILHSAYGRTNEGQYGRCGVEALQEDAWDYLARHSGHGTRGNDWIKFVHDLKSLFDFTLSPENPKVPRMVLRQYFFFMLFSRRDNKLWKRNQQIKSSTTLRLISTTQVLDHDSLCRVMADIFGHVLDFRDLHTKFLDSNNSLRTHNSVDRLFAAAMKGENMDIDLDVVGEACLLYRLERQHRDIPFHNVPVMFDNTGDIAKYVQHFPNMMRQPNRLFAYRSTL